MGEASDGEGGADINMLLSDWLEEQSLNHLLSDITQAGFDEVEELLELDDDDINHLVKELRWKVANKAKLKRAINKEKSIRMISMPQVDPFRRSLSYPSPPPGSPPGEYISALSSSFSPVLSSTETTNFARLRKYMDSLENYEYDFSEIKQNFRNKFQEQRKRIEERATKARVQAKNELDEKIRAATEKYNMQIATVEQTSNEEFENIQFVYKQTISNADAVEIEYAEQHEIFNVHRAILESTYEELVDLVKKEIDYGQLDDRASHISTKVQEAIDKMDSCLQKLRPVHIRDWKISMKKVFVPGRVRPVDPQDITVHNHSQIYNKSNSGKEHHQSSEANNVLTPGGSSWRSEGNKGWIIFHLGRKALFNFVLLKQVSFGSSAVQDFSIYTLHNEHSDSINKCVIQGKLPNKAVETNFYIPQVVEAEFLKLKIESNYGNRYTFLNFIQFEFTGNED